MKILYLLGSLSTFLLSSNLYSQTESLQWQIEAGLPSLQVVDSTMDLVEEKIAEICRQQNEDMRTAGQRPCRESQCFVDATIIHKPPMVNVYLRLGQTYVEVGFQMNFAPRVTTLGLCKHPVYTRLYRDIAAKVRGFSYVFESTDLE